MLWFFIYMYDWLHVLFSVALLCHLLLLLPLLNWSTPSVFTLNLDLRMKENMTYFVISPDSVTFSCPFPCWPLPIPRGPFRCLSCHVSGLWAMLGCCDRCILLLSLFYVAPRNWMQHFFLQLPAMSSVFLFRSRVPLCTLGWPGTRCAEFGCSSLSLPLAGKAHTGTSGSVCLMVSVF